MSLLLISSIALADPFVLVGSENRIDSNSVSPRTNVLVDISFANHLSLTTTFVLYSNYGEAYVGPSWSPVSGLAFGVAGGMEVSESPWRVMAYSSFAHGNFSALALGEYGGSGLWYKAQTSYSIGPASFGAMIQRFDGLGPRIALSHWNLELWVAPLYDLEARSPCVLVGLNWTPKM